MGTFSSPVQKNFVPEEKKDEKKKFIPPLSLKVLEVSSTAVVTLVFNRPVDIDWEYFSLWQMLKKTQGRRKLQKLTAEEEKLLFEALTDSFEVEYLARDDTYKTDLKSFEIIEFENF